MMTKHDWWCFYLCVVFMSKILVYSCKWALACRISKAVIYQVQKWLYTAVPTPTSPLWTSLWNCCYICCNLFCPLGLISKKENYNETFYRGKEYIKVIFIYNTDFSLYLVTKMFQFQNDLTSDMIDRFFLYPKCYYWRCYGYQGKKNMGWSLQKLINCETATNNK